MNTNLIPKQSVIIVGFSGGPDSLYLLNELCKLRASHSITLIAAHLNHEWRLDAAQDELWCKEYCNIIGVDFISEKISKLDVKYKANGSKESAARYYRRFFLESIAKKYANSFIALGHHLDDQIETFFIRLARGTTLAGIGSIKEQDGIYIRPLLSISKETILKKLAQNNHSFLIDSTNKDVTFLRNHIRAKIIPELKIVDSRFIKNIERSINSFQESYEAFASITAKIHATMIEDGFINLEQFLAQPAAIKKEILSKELILHGCNVVQSDSLFNEIIRFLKYGQQKQHLVHQSCQIVKNKTNFTVTNPTKNNSL